RPRSVSGTATDAAAIATISTAHDARAGRPNCARTRATHTNNAAATRSVSTLVVISSVVAGSSTSVNVCRLPQISAAPAAEAAAPSHTSTPTLSHAGENTSVARICRTTSTM